MTAGAKDRTPIVLKFGGELLEDSKRLYSVVAGIAPVAAAGEPLVIVHGAGKEIDAALAAAGVEKRQVDGLRITDQATLDVVVAVLGVVNTRFVAALNMAGVEAVGLTGADARCGLSDEASRHRATDGRSVELGRVGVPANDADSRLLTTLTAAGFVPVLACIGLGSDGRLLNVNADTLAGHVAARLAVRRLVIAGTTPGVLDEGGTTLRVVDRETIEHLITGRTVTAGMIAKLRACEHALMHGAAEAIIVDGRDRAALESAALGEPPAAATRVLLQAKPTAKAAGAHH